METKVYETKFMKFNGGDEFSVDEQGYIKMYDSSLCRLVGVTMTPDELEAVSDALRWAAGKMRQNASNANCGDCGKETE